MVEKKMPPPNGMVEMFTTPRAKEAKVVKEILRENSIKYRSREEYRGDYHTLRYCIYVPKEMSKKAYKLIDNGLLERNM